MSLAKKGARVFLSNWAMLPLHLLTGILVIRAIGAEGKGVLVILNTSVALLAMLGQLGLPAAAIYFSRSQTFSVRTLLFNFLLVTACVCLVVFGLALLMQDLFLATFFQGSDIDPRLVWLALIGLPSAMLIPFISTLFLANGQVNQYVWINGGIALLSLASTIILVIVLRLGLIGALLAPTLSQLIIAILATRMVLRSTLGQKVEVNGAVWLKLVRFGLRHFSGTVGSQLFKRSDNYLVAYFLGSQAVGYYSIAVIGYETILSLPRALNSLLAGEASDKTAQNTIGLIARACRNILWIMLAVTLLVAIPSPWIIPMVYGQDFSQSVVPFVILLMAGVLIGFTINIQTYFLGIGKPGINGMFMLVSGLANLGFSLWLIPLAGITGNALATLFGSLISLGLHLIWFQRFTGVAVRSTWLLAADDITTWRHWVNHGLRVMGVPTK